MKTCLQCQVTKPLSDYYKAASTLDGLFTKCKVCICADRKITYWSDPAARAAEIARSTRNKQARFDQDPAYRRAFRAWQHAKQRGPCVPSWVSIVDFVPICRKAIKKGPEYVLDHVIPLKHPLVCGLHVPKNLRVVLKGTNSKKGNAFTPY